MAVGFKNIIVGAIYVDARFGDDVTGNGTKENPYASKAYAESRVLAHNTTLVFGTGYYNDAANTPYAVKYIGEGSVVFDGAAAAAAAHCVVSTSTATNITFLSWDGSKNVVSGSGNLVATGCHFYYSNMTTTSSSSFLDLYRCVLKDCHIRSNSNIKWKNCFLYKCQNTSLSATANVLIAGGFIVNCHFEQCQDLLSTSSIPVTRSSGSTFDYNTIVGDLGGATHNHAYWQTYETNDEYQQNGGTTPTADVFNDFDGTRDVSLFWKQDLTMRASSPTLTSGQNGLPIGPFGKGISFSASTLFATAATTTNLVLNGDGHIEINPALPAPATGTLEVAELDLGELVFCDALHVFQNIIYQTDGQPKEYIDSELDASPNPAQNQKTTLSVRFTTSNVSGSSPDANGQFEINYPIVRDGTNKASADDGFNPSTMELLAFRYIQNLQMIFRKEA
jgi:hypothetical protein